MLRQHQDARIVGYRLGCSQYRCRTWPQARGLGQDGMVNVERGTAVDVLHGWNLVHPLPVVALVVGRVVAASPAVQHQGGFDFGDAGLGHDDVDVREQPSDRCLPAGQQVGRALHQSDRNAQRRQRQGQELHLAPDLARLGLGQHEDVVQVSANLHGNTWPRSNLFGQTGHTRQQVRAPGLARQQAPLRFVQMAQPLGFAQNLYNQRTLRNVHEPAPG